MRKDQTLLPLIVGILLLLGSAFYALQQDESGDVLEETHLKRSLPPLNQSKANVPSHKAGPGDPNSRTPQTSLKLSPKFARDTKLDFGPGILCGDSTVTFTLRDKKGQPLIAEQMIDIQLWRKLGKFWIQENAHFDRSKSTAICSGRLGTGLEPGEYEVGFRCGGYGALWKKFAVSTDQRVIIPIEFPYWRRIIDLHYMGDNKKPVRYLATIPKYEFTPPQLPPRKRKKPDRVLSYPPIYSQFNTTIETSSGGVGSSFLGYRRHNLSYLTRNGHWYLEVFAGLPGTLKQEFNYRATGRRNLDVRSRFQEEKWDSHKITVNYTKKRKADLEHRSTSNRVNKNNPGNETVLDSKKKSTVNPNIPPVISMASRILFDVNGAIPVRPHIENSLNAKISHLDVTYYDRRARKSMGTWYSDIFPEKSREISYWYSDGALLRTKKKTKQYRNIFDNQKSRIATIRDSIAANLCILSIGMPTPTSRAWARGLRVGWKLKQSPIHGQEIHRPDGKAFTVRSALALGEDENQPLPGDLVYSFVGEGNGPRARQSIELTAEQEKSLRDGTLEIEPQTKGIILRAIDANGAGLPWVEGSLIPIDSLHTAISVKKHMGQWKREARKDRHYDNSSVRIDFSPETQYGGTSLEEPLEDEETITSFVDTLSEENLRRLLKGGLYEEFSTDQERRFFAKNYTWYNTHRKFKSDRRGYLTNWNQVVEPNKRYALFLWSNSRDHLVSDSMILFTAKEGITDLGVVRLPDYQ